MANTKSASKRARQTVTRTLINQSVTTGIRSQTQRFNAALAKGDNRSAELQLSVLTSTLDKAAKRGVIHRNLANRRKSRAAQALAASGQSAK